MERINVESNSVISPFGRNPSHCSYQWQIWAHMLYIARRMRLAVSNIFTCRASNQTERKVLIVQPDLEWVEGADSRRGLISECECWNCQESHNLTTQVWRPHRKPRWCGHTLHRLRTEQKRRERNQQFKKPLCQSGAGAGRQRNTCDIVTADDLRGQTLDSPPPLMLTLPGPAPPPTQGVLFVNTPTEVVRADNMLWLPATTSVNLKITFINAGDTIC